MDTVREFTVRFVGFSLVWSTVAIAAVRLAHMLPY